MRAAPAVRARLDDSRPERVLITSLHAVSGAALSVWALALADLRTPLHQVPALAIGAVLAGALGRALARRALPADAQHLAWDGQRWMLGLQAAGEAGHGTQEQALQTVVVALDLGAWMLLRLQLAPHVWRWQAARARPDAAASWHGLQLALRFHAGAQAQPPADSARGAGGAARP